MEVASIQPVAVSKVYYGETAPLGVKTKVVLTPERAQIWATSGEKVTVAVMYDASTGFMHYGIAFCSPYDNYNRKEGRKEALRRLNERFGSVKYTLDNVSKKSNGLSPETAAKKFLDDLLISISANRNKFKKRLIEHNKAHPITAQLDIAPTPAPKRKRFKLIKEEAFSI